MERQPTARSVLRPSGRGAVLLAALCLAPAASGEAQSLAAGPEIEISLAGALRYDGSAPALAAGPDGGFLCSWWNLGFKTRAVSPTDVPLSLVRKLDPSHYGHIAPVGPGRYVAAWSDDGNLIAQFLNAAGELAGAPLTLAEGAELAQLIGIPSGGFAAAWSSSLGPSSPLPSRYLIRSFDAQGQPLGDAIDLGPLDGLSSLALLPDGFVVAWSTSLLPGGFGTQENFAQLFRADGSPAGARIALAADADNPISEPHIGVDSTGRFFIAWSEYPMPRVWARRFSSTGQPLGAPILVGGTAGRIPYVSGVAARPDGSFLVEWGESPAVSSDTWPGWGVVQARAYDAAGTPLGPSFLVHTDEDGQPYGGEAAATSDGWIVSWARVHSGAGIYARRFTLSCGTASGLCLHGQRFRAEVAWRVPATGAEGAGTPIPLTGDTGGFWFFSPANYELVVKVLDGRGVNGHFWVFYGSLTDVEFDLTITDTQTGQQRTYHNPAGTMASRADTEAF